MFDGDDVDVDVDVDEVLFEEEVAERKVADPLGDAVEEDVEDAVVLDTHEGSSVALSIIIPYAATLSTPDVTVIAVLAYMIG